MAGGAADMGTWGGLEKQPTATRSAITAQLQRLKDAGKEAVTILVVGKGGMGKSSTINTLVGDRVRPTNAFQPETLQAAEVKQSYQGLQLNFIDTPGLVEGGDVSDRALKNILQFLVGRTVDVLLYVDRLDMYSVDLTDQQLIRTLTRALGREIWSSALVVLTRSQLVPSDGRTYAEFVDLRASALQSLIRKQAGLPSSQIVPVLRVENAVSRCRTNDTGDKVLDGQVWLPLLYEAIADAALAPARKLTVTERTVEGPDPNQKLKVLIPLVLLAQVFLVFFPLQRAIQQDKKDERRNRPKWEVEAEEHRRLSASQAARK